jgi:hypothetical protein
LAECRALRIGKGSISLLFCTTDLKGSVPVRWSK